MQKVMNKYETVAMGVVYRRQAEGLEFLILRRVPNDGGFWQPITGAIEVQETAREAMLREVAEETGLREHIHVSEVEVHRQEWGDEIIAGEDVVFAVEVAPESPVALNENEHDAHEWLPLEQAVARVKYDGNKISLQKVHDYALGRGAQG